MLVFTFSGLVPKLVVENHNFYSYIPDIVFLPATATCYSHFLKQVAKQHCKVLFHRNSCCNGESVSCLTFKEEFSRRNLLVIFFSFLTCVIVGVLDVDCSFSLSLSSVVLFTLLHAQTW